MTKKTIVLLGALLILPFSSTARAKEEGVNQFLPTMTCPSNFSASKNRGEHLVTRSLTEIDGKLWAASVYAIPGTAERCAVLEYEGEEDLLSPESYAAFTTLPENNYIYKSKSSAKSNCEPTAAVIYSGFCGTSNQVIGTAYFAFSKVAITSAGSVPTTGNVCLQTSSGYHDVHAIQTNGVGDNGIAGLLLMRPGPQALGMLTVSGNMYNVGMSTIGTFSNGNAACYAGSGVASNNTFVEFAAGSQNGQGVCSFPGLSNEGGPATVAGYSLQPMGVHTAFVTNTICTFPNYYRTVNPWVRRFNLNDQNSGTNWHNSSNPAHSVTITNPINGSTRSKGNVWSASDDVTFSTTSSETGASIRVTLDGVEYGSTSKLGVILSEGWHTLSVHLASNPKLRHTVQFRQVTPTKP